VRNESAQGLFRRLIPPRNSEQVEAGMRVPAKEFSAEE